MAFVSHYLLLARLPAQRVIPHAAIFRARTPSGLRRFGRADDEFSESRHRNATRVTLRCLSVEDTEPLLDLRVPTATFVAVVQLAGGQEIRGRFFVPSHTSLHPGPMRPDERLNDDSDFFPFLPADAAEPVILNKRQVAWVSFDFRSFPTPSGDESPEVHSRPEQRVSVWCRDRLLEGVLLIDLPEDKSRVLDLLNQPERFLRIRDGDLLHYVSRDHISKVVELTGRAGS